MVRAGRRGAVHWKPQRSGGVAVWFLGAAPFDSLPSARSGLRRSAGVPAGSERDRFSTRSLQSTSALELTIRKKLR